MGKRLPRERHIEKIGAGDKFDFEKLAGQLLETVIMELDPPNCLGIFGNWGSGKSTLLHLLMDKIQSDPGKAKIQTVYFEPWKYEYANDSDLLFALLRKIENTLKLKGTKWKKHARNLLTVASSVVRQGSSLASLGAVNIDPKEIRDDMEMWENLIQSEHESWIDSVESFRETFQEAVNSNLEASGKELLVIFIDDLDRCLPENAVKLLEALKNFLFIDKTIFVLAIDRRVVSSMIEKKYDLHDGYGDEYLMKIIHYSFDLPGVNVLSIVNEVLDTYSLADEERERIYIAEFLSRFASEPRKTKHYLHQFGMRFLFGGQALRSYAESAFRRSGMEYVSRKMDVFVMSFLMARFPKIFASENAATWLTNIYARITNPSATRSSDREVDNLLAPHEQRLIREILRFGYSKTHNDRQSINDEQLSDALNALRRTKV